MLLTSSPIAISQRHHCSYDTTDKHKRRTERLKWRKPSVISRRLEIAFGTDIGLDDVGLFIEKKKIWRYDPSLPPSGSATIGRGTKRKASSSAGAGETERIRNVRSRRTRCNDNLV